MPDRAWWGHGIPWALWGVLMALIMGWLARARRKPRAALNRHILEHPVPTLVVGLGCTILFLTIAGLSARFPGRNGALWITGFFLALALLGAWIVLEYFRERHRLEPGGLRYRDALSFRSGTLRWSAVESVRYSQYSKWFRITAKDGDVVRVSALVMGLPEFAQAVLAEVRPGAIDEATRPILEQTAAGSPPSIWG